MIFLPTLRSLSPFRTLVGVAGIHWALFGAGCANSSAPEERLDGDGGSGGEGSGGAGECNEMDRPKGAICLGEVVGRVVDEEGSPVPDLPVTVCGPVCYRGVTDEDGVFSVRIERFVVVSEYSVQAHGSPHRSTFYHSLGSDLADGDRDVGTLTVVDLPDDGSLLVTKLDLDGASAPEQSVKSGGVRIDIPSGTVVRLSVADSLGGDEGKRFRARELDSDLSSFFVESSEYSRVFALGPFEGEFLSETGERAKAELYIDNTDGWPSGTRVPLYALGTYLDPSWLTPSRFEIIGTGTVSQNEAEIELPLEEPGAGLSHLTWLAVGKPVVN